MWLPDPTIISSQDLDDIDLDDKLYIEEENSNGPISQPPSPQDDGLETSEHATAVENTIQSDWDSDGQDQLGLFGRALTLY